MKKQHSLLAWRTSVLPMLLLALFVLISPVKSWADTTVEWGDWGSAPFPAGSSTISGITFTEELTYCPHSGWFVAEVHEAVNVFLNPEKTHISVYLLVRFLK